MSGNKQSELSTNDGWSKLKMKISGSIAEGEVELRPLTVFAGSIDAGHIDTVKPWMAMLIYATTCHASAGYVLRDFRPHSRSGRTDFDDNELDNFPENPITWLQSLDDEGGLLLTGGEQRTLKLFLESRHEELKRKMLSCFRLHEVGHGFHEQSNSSGSRVTFVDSSRSTSFAILRSLSVKRMECFLLDGDVMTSEYLPSSKDTLDIFGDQFRCLLVDLYAKSQGVYLGNEPGEDALRSLRWRLLSSLADICCYFSMHYLPTDRNGIMRVHRAVFSALHPNFDLDRQRIVPGVFGDSFEKLIKLADLKSKDTSTGDSSVDSAGAQGISDTLLPVALYLRHCVRPGGLLILEKPEDHLDQAMQVCLVREITRWVRQGIKVLITTHSELLLETIDNHVAAGEGKKEDSLQKTEVGVWLFEKEEYGARFKISERNG